MRRITKTVGRFWLLAALAAGLAGRADALTNYVGGYDPGGADWLSGTWPNFTNQLADLAASGDELRIAGTITRDSGTAYVTSSVAGVKITGGWNSPGEGQPWTRKDLSDTNNLSVIDGATLGYLLNIEGNDTLLEGVWLKRGYAQFGPATASNLRIQANGVTVDQCCVTDGRSTAGSGSGTALVLGGTNVTIRRTRLSNNRGANGSGVCHLYVYACDNAHISQCVFTKTASDATSYFSISMAQGAGQTVTFDNCLIYDNEKKCYLGIGNTYLINTTIHDTDLEFYDYWTVQTHFRNCVIDDAQYSFADSGVSGGDVFFENSFVTNLAYLQSQPFTNGAGVQVLVHWDEDAGNACIEIDSDTPAGFTDPDNGDFTLQAGSAAVDLGDNAYLSATYQGDEEGKSATEQTDLAENSRVLGSCVDAGAYERAPPAAAGTIVFFQ